MFEFLKYRAFPLLIPLGIVSMLGSTVVNALEKVTLAYGHNLYSAEVIVAREKGFFEKNGVELDSKLFASGRLTLDAVMAGAADMCTTAETPITAAVMSQRPIALVARIAKATPTTLVRTDTNISSTSQLKGKKLGVTAGTGSEVYTFTVLAKAGLGPEDVTMVNLRPEDMAGALASGSVDAINTWEPNISNAKSILGDKVEALATAGIYNETWNLVTLKGTVDRRSDAIAATIKAIADGEAFIRDNRDEAFDILARVVGIDRSVIEASWGNFEFRVAIDQAVPDILEAHSRWRLATGNIPPGVTQVPDFKPSIAAGPLRSVDESRVTLSGV